MMIELVEKTKKTRGLMLVLVFFDEEKERMQIRKLTQLSKK